MSFRPSEHVWAYGWHFIDSYIVSTNSPNGGFNSPPAALELLASTLPHPTPPATRDITVVVKKVAQDPAESDS